MTSIKLIILKSATLMLYQKTQHPFHNVGSQNSFRRRNMQLLQWNLLPAMTKEFPALSWVIGVPSLEIRENSWHLGNFSETGQWSEILSGEIEVKELNKQIMKNLRKAQGGVGWRNLQEDQCYIGTEGVLVGVGRMYSGEKVKGGWLAQVKSSTKCFSSWSFCRSHLVLLWSPETFSRTK